MNQRRSAAAPTWSASSQPRGADPAGWRRARRAARRMSRGPPLPRPRRPQPRPPHQDQHHGYQHQHRNTHGAPPTSTNRLAASRGSYDDRLPTYTITALRSCGLPLVVAVLPAAPLDLPRRPSQRTRDRRQGADSFPSCPIPEIARLGRTLRAWKEQLLAYFATGRASNGGTEAVNGIIELHRRIARGFRNPANYRLRIILPAGGLTNPT